MLAALLAPPRIEHAFKHRARTPGLVLPRERLRQCFLGIEGREQCAGLVHAAPRE
ncbi:MAG: hypothetical protein RR983_15340 [Massilia sp.]